MNICIIKSVPQPSGKKGRSTFITQHQIAMSNSKPSTRFEVKSFLYRLSEKLSTKESNALVKIQELPARLRDQSPFDVLMQLEMQGRYNKLEELASILKSINRDDLAKEVTTFAKKNRKKHARPECAQSHRGDANLECVLQVTKLQYNILTDQIEKLWEAANDAGHRRIEEIVRDDLKSASELLSKKLQYISGLLATEKQAEKSLSPSSSISSTSSNSEEATEVTVNPLESEIQAISKKLKSHSLPRDLPGSAHQRSKQPMLPPPPKNKPSCSAVQCTEDRVSGAIKPMTAISQPPTLKEPQVHAHAPAKPQVQVKLHVPTKPTPPPKPRVKPKTCVSAPSEPPRADVKPNRANQPVNEVPAAVVDDDDDDYSELTYTGDSGFAEASQFVKPELRREPIQPPAQPSTHDHQQATYMGLNRPTIEPAAYYKTARNCKELEDIREVMKDLPIVGNGADYVNVPRRK